MSQKKFDQKSHLESQTRTNQVNWRGKKNVSSYRPNIVRPVVRPKPVQNTIKLDKFDDRAINTKKDLKSSNEVNQIVTINWPSSKLCFLLTFAICDFF